MPRKTDGEKIDELEKQAATLEERVENLRAAASRLQHDMEKLEQRIEKRLEKIEQKLEKGGDRVWDIVKILITAIVTAVITTFISRNLGSH